MKKIFCKKSSIISLIILGACLVTMLFVSISQVSYVDVDGNVIQGIKAVQLLKSEKMKWNGYLTVETIRKVLKENQAINSDIKYAGMKESDIKLSNMKYSRKQGFQDISDLIALSYEQNNFFDYYYIDKLSNDAVDKFYPNRVNQLKTLLSGKESDQLTKNEKEYITDYAKTLTIPFKYSYADGWNMALEKSTMVASALAIVICILMAPVFSVEYQTGSDSILLSTEHGRKKGIVYKLIAGLLSTSIVYWITSAIIYGFIFMIFGFQGDDCPIQASFAGWESFYHITNSQALFMILLLGYLGCLFISSLGMFLSAKIKTSFATVILLILIIMVPATIGKQLFAGSLWNKILNLFPHQMLLGENLIDAYTLYDILGKIINPYQLLPFLYGIFAIILLPFAYKTFQKHQIA
jgi:ABC-type transport system involved in multi-copper enzyme maturation permease subunit